MPPAVIGGAIAGVGALGAAAISSSAARSAARSQTEAANRASDLQYQMFQEQMALQEPFREAGLAGQNRLLDLLGLSGNTGAAGYGSAMVPFSQTDFQADPGYAFRLAQGTQALENSAAARGLLKSGRTMAGIQDYAQGLASQEYQNAFNRYYAERNALINPLEALRGSAQTASTTMGGAASQYGVNAGNLMTSAANAAAAGRVGSANAFANALGQGASIFGNYLSSRPLRNYLSSGPSVSGMAPLDAGYNYNVNMSPVETYGF